MTILAVNAGSSSLKFALYPIESGIAQEAILTGAAVGLEPGGEPELTWNYGHTRHRTVLDVTAAGPFDAALQWLRTRLANTADLPAIRAVAHRVVHGGRQWQKSVVVNAEVIHALAALNSLAPLHQPHNLAGIRCFMQAFPELPQIACFDTTYHKTIPPEDYSFALPQALSAQGVRRYGFHGLSYQYIMQQLQANSARAIGRVLMAHLGNGASLCAARNGLSQASTMGFSALDGLMMGTRCGTLDAGVVLYLLEQGWDHAQIQNLLYKQSGLLGVSGVSADMRRLRADNSPNVKHAIKMFVHRIVRETGAMVACMQGLDVIAFSGGIGERDALTRAQCCEQLQWLGVQINPERNAAASGDEVCAIHADGSSVEIWVIPTDEGRVAAQEAARLLDEPAA